ncbi:hypothetical protein, conserved [Angomonas deanei]|uniref:Uncharacterized protein n=1 Tax=Angomonas deanei TaxID=59799 RepID=A0A7G2CM78_9TRYP|nr:hypothetical protein, conserved [Angomonas deanei]
MFSASHVRNTLAAAAVTVMLVAAQKSTCPANCARAAVYGDGTVVCGACVEGYTQDAYYSKCVKLPEGCATLDDSGTGCAECQAHYALGEDKACHRCSGDCECDATDLNTCKTCPSNEGFTSDGRTCAACVDSHCVDCLESNEQCVMCRPGYVAVDGKCEPCSDGCLICINDITKCEYCNTGYYAKDDKCEACPEGCSECEAGEDGQVKCTKPASRSATPLQEAITRAESTTCTTPKCSECVSDGQTEVCTTCEDGFFAHPALGCDREEVSCSTGSGNAALPSSSSVLSLIAAVSAAVITLAL